MLHSRERELLFRAHFARLSKVVVFCGTFGCTSKGYVVRETSLALLETEGVAFQGSLCLPNKSGGFLLHFARERGRRFSGLALLASQKWWFSVALLGAPVRGV